MQGLLINIRNWIKQINDKLVPEDMQKLPNLDEPLSGVVDINNPNLDNVDVTVSSRFQNSDNRLNFLDAPLSSISGANIKSFQQGNFMVAAGSSGVVTLSSTVNPAKCILTIQQKNGYVAFSDYYYYPDYNTHFYYSYAFAVGCKVELQATQLVYQSTMYSYPGYGGDIQEPCSVAWVVLEFE